MASDPPRYALFNDPSGDKTAREKILQDLLTLIDGAPAGSQINGAIYSFTRTFIRDALVNAVNRGVAVQLVMDGVHATEGADFLEPLVTAINAGTNCSFVSCGKDEAGGCISSTDPSKQHSKYWLFSNTTHPAYGTITFVVFVTSSNLTKAAMASQYNDAFVSWGDSQWYCPWLTHWQLQSDQKHFPDNDYYDPPTTGYIQSPNTYYTAFFSPNAKNQGDIWHLRLKEDRLPGDGATQDEGAYLYVNQAWFTDSRKTVAEDLVRIAEGGADVKIIVNEAMLGEEVEKKFKGVKNLSLKIVPTPADDGTSTAKTHHKYMVYKGVYDGVSNKQRVWCGSHNLTGPANDENDEVIVKVGDRAIADAYAADFVNLWGVLPSAT